MKALSLASTNALKSIILRQLYAVQNQLFRLNNKDLKYTRFHSQFGEDRYIFKHLGVPKQGTFVDIGAGHPISLSNTYFFERNGWNGVCIDADPMQIGLLKDKRNNVEWAAVSPKEGEIEFFQAYSPTFSSTVAKEEYKGPIKVPFKKTIRVPSFRLETILCKYNIDTIDLLSIDVEGTELEVWDTFDHKKHTPKVVIIEYYTFGLADNSKKIKDFFASLPYELVHSTCTNFIFLHKDF